MRLVLVLLMASGVMGADGRWSALEPAPAPAPRGAIETRPLWERPAMGLTLQQQAEAALDRGNDRIEDSATFQLRAIELDQQRRRAIGVRAFDVLHVEIERQRQLERQARRAAQETRRAKIIEYESERLAADRERWLRQLAKPRHAEAAIVDRQTRPAKKKD